MKNSQSLFVVVKMFLMVLTASLIGIVLLSFVYALPVDKMAEHIVASEARLRSQNDGENLANYEFSKVYDTTTNTIILYEVFVETNNSPLKDALLSPSAGFWSGEWTDTLISFAKNGNDVENDYISYARYWHGYLVFLKPLFMFFDLAEIYQINAIVQIALISVVFYLMRKRLGNYCWAYLVALLTMNPLNIMQSFQLSSIFYVLHITMILLLYKIKWNKEKILYIFVLDGILIAYFDFLTYPFVAFAIPVLTVFLLEEEDNFLDRILSMVKRGLSFIIGYAGMWGLKWILASIFTNENVILDAVFSVLDRTGLVEKNPEVVIFSISVRDAIERNLLSFLNKSNVLIIVGLLLGVCIIMRLNKFAIRVNWEIAIICILISLAPFIWFALLKNHCSLHPHLEWRTFAISAYAISVFIISLLPRRNNNE